MRSIGEFLMYSIRARLILGVVLLHAVLMGLIVLDMVGRQQRFMEHQVANDSRDLAKTLSLNAMPWLLSNDVAGLNELIGNLKRQNGLNLAVVLDRDGKVLASSDPALVNLVLSDAASAALTEGANARGQAESGHDGLFDAMSAVSIGGRRVGYTRVILDGTPVQRELDAVERGGFAYTFVAIVLGGTVAWLLVRGMTARLAQLSEAMDDVAAGRKGAELADDNGRDEVARLTRDFNRMSRALASQEERQQRLLSRLDRANDELTRLTDISAHHLQEPVRRLVLFAQRLRTLVGPDTGMPEVHSSLDQIEQDGRYLRELLRDIQLYLSAGQAADHSECASAEVALATARHRLADRIAAVGAHIGTARTDRARTVGDGSGAALPTVAMPADRLAEVFTILLDNALKYQPAGQVPDIRLEGEVADGWATLRLRDNGIGVAENQRAKVFQVFYRLHPPSAFPGTGIGLAIARRIVEGCDGTIWLEAAAGGGTVAVLHLPVADPAPPAPGLGAERQLTGQDG